MYETLRLMRAAGTTPKTAGTMSEATVKTETHLGTTGPANVAPPAPKAAHNREGASG